MSVRIKNDPNQPSPDQSAYDNALLATFITNICMAAFALLLYHIFRTEKCCRWWYTRRTDAPPGEHFWDWIPTTWKFNFEDVRKKRGVDAYLYLLILRTLLFAVLLMVVSSCVLLIPINATSENKDLTSRNEVNNNFTMCTASNITVVVPPNNTYWLNESDIWDDLGPGCDIVEDKAMLCDCTCKNTFTPIIFVPTSGTAIVTINNVNIYSGDKHRLWAHCMVIIFNSGVLCYLLFKVYMEYVALRNKYLQKKRPENYTVRTSGFDKKEYDEKKLYDIFDRFFPGEVLHVHIVPGGLKGIKQIRMERAKLVKQKESLMKKYNKDKSGEPKLQEVCDLLIETDNQLNASLHDPTTWKVSFAQGLKDLGAKASQKFQDVGSKLNLVEKKEKVKPRGDYSPSSFDPPVDVHVPPEFYTDTAYVTFKTITTARLAARQMLGARPQWTTSPAPRPDGVIWGNHVKEKENIVRFLQRCAGMFITVMLVIFWIIPVGFATALANLNTIAGISWMSWLIDVLDAIPVLRSIIEGLLPHIVLILFFMFLKPILAAIINAFDKPRSVAKFERMLSNRLFAFKVVNILFGCLLANSFFVIVNQLQEIADRPSSVVDLVGEAIPLQANFFVAFVMTNAILKAAMRLLRWLPLCITHCKLCLCARSGKARDMIKKVPPGFSYSSAIPNHVFIFLIVMTYCTITPIVIPCGITYFCFMYAIDKSLLLYFGQPKSDVVGLMFPVAFNQLCFSLCCYNLVMFGYFIGAAFVPGIVITVLTAVFSILYWVYMAYKWEDIGFYGSLDGILQTHKIGGKKYKYEYVHPLLMPIPPQEREYETHEQFLWKQRGYTLAQVSYNGVYKHTWKRKNEEAKEDKSSDGEGGSSSSGEEKIEMKDLSKRKEKEQSSSSSSSSTAEL